MREEYALNTKTKGSQRDLPITWVGNLKKSHPSHIIIGSPPLSVHWPIKNYLKWKVTGN